MNAAEPQGDSRSGARAKTIAEQRLRAAIASGQVSPGQRLVETELSEQFGVTRSSVRLALDALAAAGLVERIPNRGVRVRTVSIDEAIGIMECRMVLDGLTSRKASEHGTGEEIAALFANRDLMREAAERHDFVKYSELIQDHHRLVRDMARHPIAAALEEQLQGQIVRHQFQLSLRPGRPEQSLRELSEVIDAIARRDADGAEQAARAHFAAVIAELRQAAADANPTI